jgi:integrase
MKFADVKLDHLQMVVDESGKNYPTLRKLKVLLGLMYKYAVIHEIVPKERNMVEYLDIKKAGNPNAYNRKPFSKQEVKRVWDAKDSNIYYTVILMLIYSGCRISELLDLKKENVMLEERCFKIIEAKTAAGIRTVPIAEKVYPFFEYWYNLNECEYLLSTPEGEHFTYRNYYDSYWMPLMKTLNMEHTPHCTRHTCISMLTVAGVDDKVIKKIVGHKGQSVTEVVYTHFEIDELIDAINRI